VNELKHKSQYGAVTSKAHSTELSSPVGPSPSLQN